MYKKILTLITFCSALIISPTAAQSQNFVDGNRDLYLCDFQDISESYQLVSSYDLAKLEPSSFMQSVGFAVDRPWLYKLMDDIASTNYFAGCCSEFTPTGQANAWMVTKGIYIPGKECKLSWKSESFNPTKLDGLKVFISTEGGNPETNFSSKPVWSSEAEPAGASEFLDGEWNEHEISLDEYAGKTIWIAFVNQSNDGQILCIDDIRVYFDGKYIVTGEMPMMSTDETAIVQGRLTARNTTVTNYTIHYQTENGESATKTYSNLNIQPGTSHKFSFDEPITLGEKGEFQTYHVWAEIEGMQNAGVTDSITRVNFIPKRRVVLEEGTGTWCGYCPMGVLAIENLERVFGESIIPIAVHNQDVMTVSEYDGSLMFPNFPIGLVNRTQMCYPMAQTGNDYSFEGSGTFHEVVTKAMNEEQIADISINHAELKDGVLSVQAETAFAIRPEKSDYRVVYVVIENDVVISNVYQANYLSSYTQPIFGEYGSGGKYGSPRILNHPFQDVARTIYPSFNGRSGELPNSPEADLKYQTSAEINTANITIADSSKLEIVTLLVNGVVGNVLAADKKAVTYTSDGETGIGNVEQDLTVTEFPIYNILGIKVSQTGKLPKGIYIQNGKKFMVK